MNAQLVYPEQHAGEFQLYVLSGSGPKSYSQTTGDVINGPSTGNFIYAVPGGFLTVSKTYELKPYPSVTGSLRPTWAFKWFVVSTGVEVANAVDLSAEVVQFFAIGGQL